MNDLSNRQMGELPHPPHTRDEKKLVDIWAGTFGDDYQGRNGSAQLLASYTAMWAEILRHVPEKIDSVMEFGANLGFNLAALDRLVPDLQLWALEPNRRAHEVLQKIGYRSACMPMQDWNSACTFSLAFTRGVLIHVDPGSLPRCYEVIYRASHRYIVLAEYYNPVPVEVPYRGIAGALWKRDFAGEMLDKYPDLRLLHTGFVYHRSPAPQDDLTWFLMKKETSCR